jgi:mannan endo-1,4-beta-mannosidase
MNASLGFLPVVLGILLSPPARAAAAPANPKANARARAVLDFIQSRETRTDHRLLTGQFTNFGGAANLELPGEIFRQTGRWPALIGVDYAGFDPATHKGILDTATANQVAIAYWQAGGLVTVSAHLPNPANPAGGGLRDSGVDLDSLLAPGTATHERWMRELNVLAAGLQELKAAGVVVLWRPFHEMNGGWFWWGGQPPAKFVRVWQQMFDYFTRTKGLDNLLWVYSPNHGEHTADYYAGDAYVDLIGLDAYTDLIEPKHIRGYVEIARLPKPFGFTEFGPHGPQDPPGDYDYRRFIDGVIAHFPRTTFFMSWNDKWSPPRNHQAKELYLHPWMVNREDLPPGLAGGAP